MSASGWMLAALGIVAFLAGCAWAGSELRQGAPASERRGTTSAPARPFVVGEAKLPAGFPPPGPVGEVMVKEYPAYRLARVRSGEGGVGGGPNGMFMPLFNHIKRNDIPMTAPVEIGYSGDEVKPATEASGEGRRRTESMAFLYGDPSMGATGLDAKDRRVVVEDVPPMTVVSIGLRGHYTDSNCRVATEQLHRWLKANEDKYRVAGPPRYLAYNSPFVPGILKYGEVQLPVEPVATQAGGLPVPLKQPANKP